MLLSIPFLLHISAVMSPFMLMLMSLANTRLQGEKKPGGYSVYYSPELGDSKLAF